MRNRGQVMTTLADVLTLLTIEIGHAAKLNQCSFGRIRSKIFFNISNPRIGRVYPLTVVLVTVVWDCILSLLARRDKATKSGRNYVQFLVARSALYLMSDHYYGSVRREE